MIKDSRMYRMPEKQTGRAMVSNCARSCFWSVCKSPTLSLTFHQTEIWLFYHFSICFLSFFLILFCVSWILLHATAIHIYFASLTLMQITLHLADFTGDKNVAFDFSDACLFGHPFYFDYQNFISLASDFSFQHFNAESYEKCCNWLSHATHFKST